MSDIKLFRFTQGGAEELPGRTALVEPGLQALMERHMECFLGVRFVAHEYATGRVHRGRIDSLGLDENNCPVILEYKRRTNENVINQGLYYLDWLLDHKAEFKLLVLERYGEAAADAIEWEGTRVLCIASDFNKFDEHAVVQIGRNIELIRYKYFGEDLLMLEWVNPVRLENGTERHSGNHTSGGVSGEGSLVAQMEALSGDQRRLYEELCAFIYSLGDDINVKVLRRYLAFTRMRNFVCLLPMRGWFKLWLHLNPDTVVLEDGFSRDVRHVGHWGTGDLELSLHTMEDLRRAKDLIERAYQEN